MPFLGDRDDDLGSLEVIDLPQYPRVGSTMQDFNPGLMSLTGREMNVSYSHNSDMGNGAAVLDQTDEIAGTQASSRPPSSLPISTSRIVLGIRPCPVRLTPLIPPANYGTVEKNMIYRSGFPSQHNIDFVESLNINSIMTLVDTAPSDEYCRYIREYNINRIVISIAPNKDGRVGTTSDSLCEALLFALNPTHHPLYIHCNQGRHRTGCIIGCLRKIQQWPLDEILAEYDAYASPKARPGDIDLITSFDPETVFRYAKSKGLLYYWSRLVRVPPSRLANVHSLAAGLPRHKLSQLNDSSSDDDDDCTSEIFWQGRSQLDHWDVASLGLSSHCVDSGDWMTYENIDEPNDVGGPPVPGNGAQHYSRDEFHQRSRSRSPNVLRPRAATPPSPGPRPVLAS